MLQSTYLEIESKVSGSSASAPADKKIAEQNVQVQAKRRGLHRRDVMSRAP